MNPTFKQGNELMVNKFSHRYKTIRRFDIVLFKAAPQSADQTSHRAPRRVNRIQEDQLYVNGKRVAEPF